MRADDEEGVKRPVDLDLVDRGGHFESVNPLARVRFGDRAGAGMLFEDSGVRLVPRGGDAAASEHGDRLFYPEIATDTDFVAMPLETGAESFWQIRSADAPQEFALDVELPAGVTLRYGPDPSGGSLAGRPVLRRPIEAIREDGKVVARVLPPMAKDADGEPVGATMALDGNAIRVAIDGDGAADAKYPILLDPVVEDYMRWTPAGSGSGQQATDGSITFNGWNYLQGGSWGTLGKCAGCPDWWKGNGLYLYGLQGNYFSADRWHEWNYTAPGDAYIYRADFGWVWHQPAALMNGSTQVGASTVTEGIWSTRDFGWETACVGQPYQPCYNQRPWVSTATYNELFLTHCQQPCWWGDRASQAGTPGNKMVFAQTFNANGTAAYAQPTVVMGGAQVGMHEYVAPRLAANGLKHTGLPTGWVKSATIRSEVSATDSGLGLQSLNLSSPTGWSKAGVTDGCNGAQANTSDRPCSKFFYVPFDYNTDSMPEGIVRVNATARDIVGNQANIANWQVKVDRGAPTISEPSGPLYERRNRADDRRREGLYDPQAAIRVEASEGSNANDATKRSGVRKLELFIDRNRDGDFADNGESVKKTENLCAGGQCPYTTPLDYALATDTLGDGDYDIKLVATDLVGNSSEKTWTVTVDRQGAIHRTSEYDETQEGFVGTDWAKLEVAAARRETRTYIKTRAGNEVRVRTRATETDPSDEDSFWVRRGQTDSDPNLEAAAGVLEVRRESDRTSWSTAATGALVDALLPWQRPPAASSDRFERRRRTNGNLTFDVWREVTSRLPVKATATNSAGQVESVQLWSYERSRATDSEVPADHFAVQRPGRTGYSEQEDFGYAGGTVRDDETTTSFLPRFLGPTLQLGASTLCFSRALEHRSQLSGEAATGTDELDQPDEERGDYAGRAAPSTGVDAYYVELPAGSTCGEVAGKALFTPPLMVWNMAATSSEARAWTQLYTEEGEYVALNPADDDSAFAGVSPVLVEGQVAMAYVMRDDAGDTSSFLVRIGDTTLIVRGPFEQSAVPTVAAGLRPF